ncbi:hypothetical protein BDN70DRAFT_763691, partial [Pholiota conissans]
GIHLLSATQAMLHRGIHQIKSVDIRTDTLASLDITRYRVKELRGKFPTDKEIWLSLRSKNIAKRARGFLWKTMHNGYRIGDKWSSIPNFEHRANCGLCGEEETMEHILHECQNSEAITIIWKLA